MGAADRFRRFHVPSPVHPALWTGDELPGKRGLVTALPIVARRRLGELVRRHASRKSDPGAWPRESFQDELLATALAPVKREVKSGRGFAIVSGLPVEDFEPATLRLAYGIVGSQLGFLQSQSNLGDRIGEVTDVTASDPHARGYRSARPLQPHTDICDMIALLAVRTPWIGGVSAVASGYTVHERLRQDRPDLLARLYDGERYHRRGEEAPGEEPITPHRIPVFSETGGQLNLRFVRRYMEHALRTEGRTDALLLEAFDAIERIAEQTAFTFTLEPGEMLLLNNLVVLHARTGFEDVADPAKKRLLLRLWLNDPGFRAQSPDLHLYGHGDGVPHVPGRTSSYANFG